MKIEHYQNKDETEVLNIWLKASEQAHAFAGVGFWCGLVEDMRQVYLPRARTWVSVSYTHLTLPTNSRV